MYFSTKGKKPLAAGTVILQKKLRRKLRQKYSRYQDQVQLRNERKKKTPITFYLIQVRVLPRRKCLVFDVITIACRSFQDRKIIRCFDETRKYSTYWYFKVSSRLKYSLNWFCGSVISRGLFSFRNKLDRSMPVMCLVKKSWKVLSLSREMKETFTEFHRSLRVQCYQFLLHAFLAYRTI